MYSHSTQLRVRYGETDRMGYLYYGNYAQYYEVGRVEMLRSLGLEYKKMEDGGILLPVLSLQSKFVKPALYDELITITTKLIEMPAVRIHFSYELLNPAGELINLGDTTLVFVDAKTRKLRKAPAELLNVLQPYFPQHQ